MTDSFARGPGHSTVCHADVPNLPIERVEQLNQGDLQERVFDTGRSAYMLLATRRLKRMRI